MPFANFFNLKNHRIVYSGIEDIKEDLKNHKISDEDIRLKMKETLESAKKDFS